MVSAPREGLQNQKRQQRLRALPCHCLLLTVTPALCHRPLWATHLWSQPFPHSPAWAFTPVCFPLPTGSMVLLPTSPVMSLFPLPSRPLCPWFSALWCDRTRYWPVSCFLACTSAGSVHRAHSSSQGGLYFFMNQIASAVALLLSWHHGHSSLFTLSASSHTYISGHELFRVIN